MISERSGEEAIDVAERLFIAICHLAANDALAEARLSHMVFAAYWPAPGSERNATEMFQRWFPMEVKTPHYTVPFDAASFAVEVSSRDSSRDVFDRVAAQLDDEALPRGWDGQVG